MAAPGVTPAYAQLVSASFTHAVTPPTQSLTVGRAVSLDAEDAVTSDFRGISTNKNISRRHAVISWVAVAGAMYWCIRCLSKNGLTVNTTHVAPEQGDVRLSNKDRIMIGDVVIFWIMDPAA